MPAPIEAGLAGSDEGGAVIVIVQPACEQCLSPLLEGLCDSTLDVERVRVGVDPATPGLSQWVRVEEKIVWNERGMRRKVDSFLVRRSPITVTEFEHFIRITGYVTSAERAGDRETFRSNGALEGLTGGEAARSAAGCISYDDALAYARWAMVELPTDWQWLAAAVLQWEVLSEAEYYRRLPQVSADPSALRFAGLEWTRGQSAARQYLRSRPTYLLQQGWEKMVNRIEAKTSERELTYTFRTVSDLRRCPGQTGKSRSK